MARRGTRFGALPRAVPSLQATILAEARAQQQATQQNMFDAWQHGGLGPNGKPVEDEDLLKYIKTRRDQLSKDDPEWTMWDNSLTQYTFAIGESKHNLAYQQGKLSAQGFANWYKGQLSSLDKDTEWYRTVAGKAAGWAKSAVSQARAHAKELANQQLQKDIARNNRPVESFNSDMSVLSEFALSHGLIQPGQDITDIPVSLVETFWSMVATAKPKGADGKPITQGTFAADGRAAEHGANATVKALKQAGYSTTDAKSSAARIRKTNSAVGSDPWEISYGKMRAAWIADIRDAKGNPELINAINQKYGADLAELRGRVMDSPNPNVALAGALENEVNVITTGRATGPTVTDEFDNRVDGASSSSQDAESTAEDWARVQQDYAMIAAGQAYYGQADPGGALGVVPFVIDPRTGAASMGQDQTVAVLNIDGHAVATVMKGAPIYGVQYKNKQGQVITPTQEELDKGLNAVPPTIVIVSTKDQSGPVGYMYTEGQTKQWGVVQPDGSIIITKTNPFPATGPNGGVLLNPDGTPVGGSFMPGTMVPAETDRDGNQVPAGSATIVDDSLSPTALVQFGKENPNSPAGIAAWEAGNVALHTRHLENELGYAQAQNANSMVNPDAKQGPVLLHGNPADPRATGYVDKNGIQRPAFPGTTIQAAPAPLVRPVGPHSPQQPALPGIKIPNVPSAPSAPMAPSPGSERPMTTGPGNITVPPIPQYGGAGRDASGHPTDYGRGK